MSIWGEIEIEGGAFLIGTNQFLLVIANTVVSISCSVWLQLLFILSCGREDKPCLSGGGTTSSQNPSSSQLSSSSQSNIKGGTYRLTNKRSKPGLSSRFGLLQEPHKSMLKNALSIIINCLKMFMIYEDRIITTPFANDPPRRQ